MALPVEIKVLPSLSSLIDAPLQIKVSGLAADQPVTIAAGVEENGDQFVSYGHFVSDSTGCVDLTKARSFGGTFSGVYPMGLFWSLQEAKGQKRTGLRIMKKDATQPIIVHLSVKPDHVDVDYYNQIEGSGVLCNTVLQRHLLSDDVKRIPVREDGVIGTLFVPRGDGVRHPGIIDLYGIAGGLVEYRAALLANRGFVTLALAYSDLEHLPTSSDKIELEYFENAIELLDNHASVFPGKLGVMGHSQGGMLAPFLTAISKKIKAGVIINANHFNNLDITFKGRQFDRIQFDYRSGAMITEQGVTPRNMFMKQTNSFEAAIPIAESTNVKYLLLYGEDDQLQDPLAGRRIKEMCDEGGRNVCELITYPGVGHLLEPPHLPVCKRSFAKDWGTHFLWGGETEPQAAAQEDSWKRIIDFFNRELGQEQSKL